MFFNGNSAPTLTIDLTGTVAAGDVFVLAQSSAAATILAAADQTNGSGWFNGDDAVALYKGDTAIDVIGQTGPRPRHRVGHRSREHSRQHAPAPAGRHRRRPERHGRVRPCDAVGRLRDRHVRRARHPHRHAARQRAGLRDVPAHGHDHAGDGGHRRGPRYRRGRNRHLAHDRLGQPAPAAGTIALTGFAPATADGGTASATLAVAAGVPPRVVRRPAHGGERRRDTADGHLLDHGQRHTVLRVSEVQGAVSDLVAGPTHRSALAPLTGNGTSSTLYDVRGVITQRTLARSSAGVSQFGFFLQDTGRGRTATRPRRTGSSSSWGASRR